MLTPRGKSPLPEKKKSPRRGWNSRRCIKQDSEPNALPTEILWPHNDDEDDDIPTKTKMIK